MSRVSGTREGSWWSWEEPSSVSHLAGGAQLVPVALCPGAHADGFPCYECKLLPELSVRPMLVPVFRMRPLGKETKAVGLSVVVVVGLDEGAASFDSVPCCAKSLQSFLTLYHPVDCNLPGSSVHGILQARILEWVAMPSSRGSSRPGDRTCVFLCLTYTGRQVLRH